MVERPYFDVLQTGLGGAVDLLRATTDPGWSYTLRTRFVAVRIRASAEDSD